MLEGGGAVAALGLVDLVGLPAALHREHRQLLALVGEQQPLAHRHLSWSVSNTIGRPNSSPVVVRLPCHHRLVVLLVHEAQQGREAAHHQQLHIAGIAVAALDHPINAGLRRLALLRRHDQIHQRAAVGGIRPVLERPEGAAVVMERPAADGADCSRPGVEDV